MITFGNLLEDSLKVTVSLLFMVDCQMLVFIIFYLTLKEMLFREGPGVTFLCCIVFYFYRWVEVL